MASYRIKIALASGLAEVFCLYPLYLLASAGLKSTGAVSFGKLLALAFVAVATNLVLAQRRFRLLTILLINLVLSLFASGWLVHHAFFSFLPFYPLSWAAFFFSLRFGYETLLLSWLVAATALWIWIRGALLVRKPPTFNASVSRFDTSLGFMFILFLIAGLNGIPVPGGVWWLLGLLLSNAAAMSLAQAAGRAQGNPAWPGPVFLALLLAPALLAVTIFFPELSMLGTVTYDTCSPFARGLGNILQNALLWLLKRAHPTLENQNPSSTIPATPMPEAGAAASTPAWLTGLLQVFIWVAIALVLLAAIATTVYLLSLLFSKLWARQEPAPLPASGKGLLWWWRDLILLANRWMAAVRFAAFPWLAARPEPIESYRALLKWGKRRGRPRFKHETPYEYLYRLTQRFPEKQADLSCLTEHYVNCYYGGKPPELRCATKLKSALRRLSLPSFQKRKKR